ncbi:LysR family transcriptional regulator [Achromobacter marplatensis]|uniref:LysR family transcriptional regulator n=1 Tax=Achromobacter marplatensis TaxID=470868 RepID=A0ABX9G4W0_9BURK|nr:LysR family transcriptional regulator [Achromobacter marplatensis]OWT57734.1 LysR family transcriptional regulator [Achromobacter marplatensis]RBP14206.1 LysR family transcriptional regulator [Achromobacter marplatensis]CAB3707069.1 HTH-type transcriptional activator CmpR [Achromobacter marplatensis]
MRGLNLDHLRTFAQVVELGSFSAAAERGGVTQPAVSLQIRQLERRFGVKLVERIGRRAGPTAAGLELLTHIRVIDAALAQAEQAMSAHASQVSGRIRLGTGATACTYLLPSVLADLRRRFPALDIVASTGNTSDMLRGLENNTLDMALVTLPAPGRMFQVNPVMEDEFVAIFPARDAGAIPDVVTPQSLAGLPLVLFEPGARTRRLVDDWFEAAGLAAKPVMELGSTEAMKEIVAAGLGCAVLPKLAVSGAGQRDALAVRSLTPRLSRDLALVLRRDKPLSRGLRHLQEALLALHA